MGEFRPVRLERQRSADGLLLGPGKVGEGPQCGCGITLIPCAWVFGGTCTSVRNRPTRLAHGSDFANRPQP
jgi:hypothetical protein